jgi:hypothetical protein
LNLAIGGAIGPGTVGRTAEILLCNEQNRVPLVSKKQLSSMKFKSLSSTADGEGELLYEQLTGNVENEKEVIMIYNYPKDRSIKYMFSEGVSIPDIPNYRVLVSRVKEKCTEKKWLESKAEFYDSQNNLVYVKASDPSIEPQWSDFGDTSPMAIVQSIICSANQTRQ